MGPATSRKSPSDRLAMSEKESKRRVWMFGMNSRLSFEIRLDLLGSCQAGSGSARPFGQVGPTLGSPPPDINAHFTSRFRHQFQQRPRVLLITGPNVVIGQCFDNAAVSRVVALRWRQSLNCRRKVAPFPRQ